MTLCVVMAVITTIQLTFNQWLNYCQNGVGSLIVPATRMCIATGVSGRATPSSPPIHLYCCQQTHFLGSDLSQKCRCGRSSVSDPAGVSQTNRWIGVLHDGKGTKAKNSEERMKRDRMELVRGEGKERKMAREREKGRKSGRERRGGKERF